MRQRRLIWLGVVLAVVAATLVSCSSGSAPRTVNYLVDARVGTYNPNTVDGSADGVLMAFTRTLPGFSYLGPDGRVVADHDFGTATPEPGDRLRVRYVINPRATYSDQVAVTCDDLVLAWAAQSGRFDGFAPATTAGYRDIESVDCTPGSREAVVTFAAGRNDGEWDALFGAGALLPSHVIARAVGVGSVVTPIRGNDSDAIARIARFWNTGWTLTPGRLGDAAAVSALFPSAGPYRLHSYSERGGLVLVANDSWWGPAPVEKRITVWPRGTDGSERLKSGDVDVMDTSANTYGDQSVSGGSGGSASAAPVSPTSGIGRLGVEQIVMSSSGLFADPAMRQAFAYCVPRDQLAQRFSGGAGVWNLHIAAPGSLTGVALSNAFGGDHARADLTRARALLPAGGAAPVVRIGYLAPDYRRAAIVRAIADSCAEAGITIRDMGSPGFTVGDLGRSVDAVITAGGASLAASGAADPIRDAYAFVGADPLNIGGFGSPRVDDAVAALAVATDDTARIALMRTIETELWAQMPALPLFAAPRTQQTADTMRTVVSGAARSATGWNMDRWEMS